MAGSQLLASGPLPPVGSSKRKMWVLKTVARRGAARAALGLLAEAVADYRTACGLDPDDKALERDLAALEKKLAVGQAATPAGEASMDPATPTTPEAVAATTGAAPEEELAPPPAVSPAENGVPAPIPPPPPPEAVTPAETPAAARSWPVPVPGASTTMAVITAPAAVESGDVVGAGARVTMHARGRLAAGAVFWDTRASGQLPFTYKAGVGAVIRGWDAGCLGMRVGETRKLAIPAREGYGAAGFPQWGIPPNADLEFTIECLHIKAE